MQYPPPKLSSASTNSNSIAPSTTPATTALPHTLPSLPSSSPSLSSLSVPTYPAPVPLVPTNTATAVANTTNTTVPSLHAFPVSPTFAAIFASQSQSPRLAPSSSIAATTTTTATAASPFQFNLPTSISSGSHTNLNSTSTSTSTSVHTHTFRQVFEQHHLPSILPLIRTSSLPNKPSAQQQQHHQDHQSLGDTNDKAPSKTKPKPNPNPNPKPTPKPKPKKQHKTPPKTNTKTKTKTNNTEINSSTSSNKKSMSLHSPVSFMYSPQHSSDESGSDHWDDAASDNSFHNQTPNLHSHQQQHQHHQQQQYHHHLPQYASNSSSSVPLESPIPISNFSSSGSSSKSFEVGWPLIPPIFSTMSSASTTAATSSSTPAHFSSSSSSYSSSTSSLLSTSAASSSSSALPPTLLYSFYNTNPSSSAHSSHQSHLDIFTTKAEPLEDKHFGLQLDLPDQSTGKPLLATILTGGILDTIDPTLSLIGAPSPMVATAATTMLPSSSPSSSSLPPSYSLAPLPSPSLSASKTASSSAPPSSSLSSSSLASSIVPPSASSPSSAASSLLSTLPAVGTTPIAPFPSFPFVKTRKSPAVTKKRRPRKVATPPVDKTVAARRAKHNQVEIRRRERISERFTTLRQLTGCDGAKKGVILEHAVAMIHQMMNKIRQTEQNPASNPTMADSSSSSSSSLPTQAPSSSPLSSSLPSSAIKLEPGFSFNSLSNDCAIPSFCSSLSGAMLQCNLPLAQLMGFNSVQDLIASSTQLFHVPELASAIARLAAGQVSTVDCYRRFSTASGTSIHVRWTLWVRDDPAFNTKVIHAIVVPLQS